MPKVTYPRPCQTCGKKFKESAFFFQKKQCGTTENRYHCPLCPLSFTQLGNKHRHIRQHHSNKPPWFTCPECNQGFTTKHNRNLHLETVCAEVKPCYKCWLCNARFTRHHNRQRHMRRVHGRICREEEINLLLHLQHLSEEPSCKDEWTFVESRPVKVGEHNKSPCGQNDIQSYFFLENKINGNRTFVGSTCIENIDPHVGDVIGYFQYILRRPPIHGTFDGNDSSGLQKFTVKSNTVLVTGADTTVNHLNPQVIKTKEGERQVLVKYTKPETLIQGQSYELCLKAKYVRGQLTFTAV